MTKEQDKVRQQINQTIKRFGRKRGNIVPLLQNVWERLVYLPREVMHEIADSFKPPSIDTYIAVTF